MHYFKKICQSFFYTTILLAPMVLLVKVDNLQREMGNINHELISINQRLDKPAEIVYQVDSAGASWHGKVTNKEIKNDRYGVEIGSYGWFMVTKEQYEALNIGDDAPEELKERGN